MRSAQINESGKLGGMIKPVLFGLFGGIILSILILGIFSLIFTANGLPEGAAMPMAIASVCLGALSGGFITSRLYNNKGLISGALTGLLFFILLYIVGAIMHQIDLGSLAFLKLIMSVISGSIGGILGVNTGRKGR